MSRSTIQSSICFFDEYFPAYSGRGHLQGSLFGRERADEERISTIGRDTARVFAKHGFPHDCRIVAPRLSRASSKHPILICSIVFSRQTLRQTARSTNRRSEVRSRQQTSRRGSVTKDASMGSSRGGGVGPNRVTAAAGAGDRQQGASRTRGGTAQDPKKARDPDGKVSVGASKTRWLERLAVHVGTEARKSSVVMNLLVDLGSFFRLLRRLTSTFYGYTPANDALCFLLPCSCVGRGTCSSLGRTVRHLCFRLEHRGCRAAAAAAATVANVLPLMCRSRGDTMSVAR